MIFREMLAHVACRGVPFFLLWGENSTADSTAIFSAVLLNLFHVAR
jgi:hypothetical protein